MEPARMDVVCERPRCVRKFDTGDSAKAGRHERYADSRSDKYTRLTNRNLVKAIESEEEYDRMVPAVNELMDKGEDHLSVDQSALLETLAVLIQATMTAIIPHLRPDQ